MLGDIVTLPIRLTARAASLALRGTEEAANYAIGLATRLTGGGRSAPAGPAVAAESPPAASPPKPRPRPAPQRPDARRPVPSAPPVPPASEPAPEAFADTPPEPAHVSEEPELVAQVAESGAESGAGPEIHVEEPWDGYHELAADDVIDRLAVADSAELAAVGLYENLHRKRPTVLEAVERQLEQAVASNGSD